MYPLSLGVTAAMIETLLKAFMSWQEKRSGRTKSMRKILAQLLLALGERLDQPTISREEPSVSRLK